MVKTRLPWVLASGFPLPAGKWQDLVTYASGKPPTWVSECIPARPSTAARTMRSRSRSKTGSKAADLDGRSQHGWKDVVRPSGFSVIGSSKPKPRCKAPIVEVKQRRRIILQVRMRGLHWRNQANLHLTSNVPPTLALARIHRWTACGRPAEETKGCASESGIMVLKQKTGPRKGAPNRCYHATTPTASKSPSTTGQSRLNQGAL